ncbi:hypothetical protein [Haloplanus halobius]|uniref:hypothetical protein n=1 Tax=Haloplanus halobius TaxID=2934938 RepID=UPI00200F203B|nr:hypothetical protein [Haloplanus sp. XH21]
MSLRRDVRHGLRIARAEFVRSVRGYIRNKRRLAGLVVVVLFFGGNFLFALPAAYAVGLAARSIESIPYFAPAATVLPVGLLALATLRTLERISRIDAEELILTAVHPRAVVVGLIGAELGRLTLWFGVPLVAVTAAFALGLGSLSLLLSAALVSIPLVCWAAIWGYALGITTLRLLRRLPGVRRVLKVGGVLAMVAIIVGSQFIGRYLVEGGASITALMSRLAVTPLTDYAALAFVGTPLARPLSISSLAVLGGLLALTPAGLVVATRQVSQLWFTDAPQADTRQPRSSAGWLTAPRPFAWRKAGRVAWGFLVRTGRHPQELAHLVMVLFFLGPLGTTIAQSSGNALGTLIAGTGVGLGAYLSGAAFGLNPLGDDRPQLPVLLLTATDSRTLVRGRLLAGIAVGGPVAVLGPLASILLGTTPLDATVFAGVGLVMCLAAALFSVGLGSAYPVYEEREFWGTETVVPSTLVMIVYILVVGSGTVIGLFAMLYALTTDPLTTPLFIAGFGIYLALTASVSYASYRYAVRRYRRYTVA